MSDETWITWRKAPKFHKSKKSPTGPTEPEYLIALATYLGVRWDSVPFNFSLNKVWLPNPFNKQR